MEERKKSLSSKIELYVIVLTIVTLFQGGIIVGPFSRIAGRNAIRICSNRSWKTLIRDFDIERKINL